MPQPAQPTNQTSPPAGVDKAACAARLSRAARLTHQHILTTFARTGRPPTRADLWRATGAAATTDTAAAALAELASLDLVVLDPHGELLAAYPFSAAPTPHRLTLQQPGDASGQDLHAHAMCAIDALGISAMLGAPVTVTSTEPGTSQPVTVHVDGDRATWEPATAVVLAGATADCCAPSAERTCGHLNFFTTPEAARAWAAAHPGLTWTLLAQPEALACAAAQFGPLLQPPDPAETTEVERQ